MPAARRRNESSRPGSPGGGGVYQIARGFLGVDHHHFRASGLSFRNNRRIFKALSLTMAGSLFISFLVAWLAVPLLADHFLNEKDARQEEGGRFTARVRRLYGELMR